MNQVDLNWCKVLYINYYKDNLIYIPADIKYFIYVLYSNIQAQSLTEKFPDCEEKKAVVNILEQYYLDKASNIFLSSLIHEVWSSKYYTEEFNNRMYELLKKFYTSIDIVKLLEFSTINSKID